MDCVPRIEKIDVTAFIGMYIAAGRPVIVTDAMTEWPAKYKWTPKYFRERFGSIKAQVYDNLFTMRDIRPLGDYLDQYFDKQGHEATGLYVRWYTQFKHVDFYWSDGVFDALASDWSHPYFLPVSSYVVPLCRNPETLHAPTTTFPYKGLFISAQGSRTRLHRDPFGTDAVLCQFYGTKSLTFYAPADDGKLRQGTRFVDPRNPDKTTFPNFSTAAPIYIDELRPGEILYIPNGWFHDVVSVTDSISVTWNFVHAANKDPFLRAISDPTNDFDRDMLDFFFSREVPRTVSVDEMKRIALTV